MVQLHVLLAGHSLVYITVHIKNMIIVCDTITFILDRLKVGWICQWQSASWCTNVGNEYGQVIMSDSEGDGLDMADGLMARYIKSNIPPPKVLYVDRDCCSSKVKEQFHKFPNMVVRLDIWHYIQRLAVACCSESHALYGTFLLRLSGAIFEWDPDDIERLYNAKQAQLSARGLVRAANGLTALPK